MSSETLVDNKEFSFIKEFCITVHSNKCVCGLLFLNTARNRNIISKSCTQCHRTPCVIMWLNTHPLTSSLYSTLPSQLPCPSILFLLLLSSYVFSGFQVLLLFASRPIAELIFRLLACETDFDRTLWYGCHFQWNSNSIEKGETQSPKQPPWGFGFFAYGYSHLLQTIQKAHTKTFFTLLLWVHCYWISVFTPCAFAHLQFASPYFHNLSSYPPSLTQVCSPQCIYLPSATYHCLLGNEIVNGVRYVLDTHLTLSWEFTVQLQEKLPIFHFWYFQFSTKEKECINKGSCYSFCSLTAIQARSPFYVIVFSYIPGLKTLSSGLSSLFSGKLQNCYF